MTKYDFDAPKGWAETDEASVVRLRPEPSDGAPSGGGQAPAGEERKELVSSAGTSNRVLLCRETVL